MDTNVEINSTYKYLLIYAKRNIGMLNKNQNGYPWTGVEKSGLEGIMMKARLL